MEIQEIEVVIDPDGTTRIEVRGVSGPSCLALTEDLEAALGGDVVERERRPEMDRTIEVDTPQHVWRRG